MKKKSPRSPNSTPAGKKSRSTVAGKAQKTAERMILKHCEPHVWIDYAKKSGRGRWPEAEKRILRHEDDKYIVDYARDVIKGRWNEGESRLRYSQTRYAKEVIRGRWPELEQHLVTQEEWIQVGYATEVLAGTERENVLLRLRAIAELMEHWRLERGRRWPECEPILFSDGEWVQVMEYLKAVAADPWPERESFLMRTRTVCEVVDYALEIKQVRWPEFEKAVLAGLDLDCEAWQWTKECCEKVVARTLAPGIEYAAKVIGGQWPELRKALLKLGNKGRDGWGDLWSACIAYAKEQQGGRWVALERTLLHDLFDPVEVSQYYRNISSGRCKTWESELLGERQIDQSIMYAAEVIRGRWLELEALFEREIEREWESVTSNQLCDYASRVIQGRLPENLHNIMLMEGTKNSEDPSVKRYARLIESQA